jgi:hypothetical protein
VLWSLPPPPLVYGMRVPRPCSVLVPHARRHLPLPVPPWGLFRGQVKPLLEAWAADSDRPLPKLPGTYGSAALVRPFGYGMWLPLQQHLW